jgi:hypothetical protein
MLLGSDLPLRAAEWIRVHMSTQNDGGLPVLSPEAGPSKAEQLPKPPMLWLLILVALLAVLAFSSRG